jgi:hypothetical protein
MTVALVSAAVAEHEVDHRYTVKGYVLDEQERPVRDAVVTIRHKTRVLNSGTTDSRGFYDIRLHLHDSALGEELRVGTQAHEAIIEVAFERGDARTPRIHHVNFVGGRIVEEKLAWRGFPMWVYVAGGIALAVAAAAVTARRIKREKRKRKRKDSPKHTQPRKRSRKPKKKRRR